MDIRTKLALALVSVSLVSMAILGAFAYSTTADLVQRMSIRQLNALAESKSRDLDKVQEGWRDQLRLIKSRRELATDLEKYLATGDKSALQTVDHIIQDAVTAVDDVENIRVLDLNGKAVATYGKYSEARKAVVPNDPSKVVYNETLIDSRGQPIVVFSSLLAIDGKAVGVIEAAFNTRKLLTITGNYTGLGKTGEAMVLMRDAGDTVQVLNPLRHGKDSTLERVPFESASAALRQAISPAAANSGSLSSVDYRGAPVWAVTRYVPSLNWGLVVKVDKTEEQSSSENLKDDLIDIALSLSVFAIVGGTALGFYLARPIHDLAVLVRRIRHGEPYLRADDSGDDEIAYLADSINELMDHMQAQSDDNNIHG